MAYAKETLRFQTSKIIALLYSMILIIELHPYFLWNNNNVFRIISLVLFVVILKYLYGRNIDKSNWTLFMYIFAALLYFQILNMDKLFFINTIIILFLLLDKETKKLVFLYFYNAFIFTLIPGILLYLLIFLGFDIGWSSLEPNHGLKSEWGHYYRNYYGLIILDSQIFPTSFGEVFRFSAIYDEPGRVGTMVALLLAATKFQLNTWKSKILLISGILSFSLAFFSLMFVFYLVKKPIKSFLILLIFIMSIMYMSQNSIDSPFIEKYIVERISLAVSDPEAVNNRVNDEFTTAYINFLNSGNIMIGNGKNAYLLLKAGVSTYKTLFYDYGLIGCLLIFLIYLFLTVFFVNTLNQFISIIPFLFVFTANIFQRPDVFTLNFFIIFIGALLYNQNIQRKIYYRT